MDADLPWKDPGEVKGDRSSLHQAVGADVQPPPQDTITMCTSDSAKGPFDTSKMAQYGSIKYLKCWIEMNSNY